MESVTSGNCEEQRGKLEGTTTQRCSSHQQAPKWLRSGGRLVLGGVSASKRRRGDISTWSRFSTGDPRSRRALPPTASYHSNSSSKRKGSGERHATGRLCAAGFNWVLFKMLKSSLGLEKKRPPFFFFLSLLPPHYNNRPNFTFNSQKNNNNKKKAMDT